jgi:O-antigen/teichoic acid export membrane protein
MKRNLLYTAISIGSRLLTGLVVFILLARIWGPGDFGLFSFIFSASALLALIVDFGFAGYILRELGADPGKAVSLVRNAFWAKALLTIAFIVISGAGLLLAGPQLAPPDIAVPLLIAALFLSFSDFFVAPLRALGRYDVETLVVTSANFLQFAIGGGVAWFVGTTASVAYAFALSRILYLGAAAYTLHRLVPGLALRHGNIAPPLNTLSKVWPYGVDGVLTNAWGQLDVIAVRAIFGVTGAGVYAAGQRIVQGVSALAPVVGNVMIPKLSRLAKNKDARFQSSAVRTALAMAAIGILFAVPLVLFPSAISNFVFGDKFSALESLLPLFGLLIFLKYVAAGSGVVMTAAGLQQKRVMCQVIGLSTFALLTAWVFLSHASLATYLLAYAGALVVMAVLYARLWRRYHISTRM